MYFFPPLTLKTSHMFALPCMLMIAALSLSAKAQDSSSLTIDRQQLTKVYQYDQSTQCNHNGIPLDQMRLILESDGITVNCAHKGNDGELYPAVCDGESGGINVYQIKTGDSPLARRLGFSPVSELPHYRDRPCRPTPTKVFKYDGSTQCNNDGIPLGEMAQELVEAGIDVLCSQQANDGMLHPAVCGGATGTISVYQIHPASLGDAFDLGFQSVQSLSEYRDRPCLNTEPAR